MIKVLVWNRTNKIVQVFNYRITVNQHLYIDKVTQVNREIVINGETHPVSYNKYRNVLFLD